MPVAAAIIPAVISAGAAVYSSSQQSKAIKSAANASTAATQQVRADAAPWRTAGADALARISNPNEMLKNFQASPDYNFRLQQGLDAVGTNKAVNGLLKSGKALKDYTRFAQGTAAGEFGDWWNRQFGLSGNGLQAAGITVNPTMTNATNQGNAAIAGANNTGQLAGSLADIFSKYGGDIFKNTGSSYAPASGSAGYSDLPVYA